MRHLYSWICVVVVVLAMGCGGGSTSSNPPVTDTTQPDVPVQTDTATPDAAGCVGEKCCEVGEAGQTYCAEKFGGCSRCLEDGMCSTCTVGEVCLPSGQCCARSCEGKECGDDGCGGKCGNCSAEEYCSPEGVCESGQCAPQCDGKQCGDDTCGGKCGDCLEGQICDAMGLCQTPGSGGGDTCENPIAVDSFPYTTSGDTTGYGSDYGYSTGACPGETSSWGNGSADTVYAFTPAAAAYYAVTLMAQYDSNLYVVTNCNDVDAACLGANDEIGSNKEEKLNLYLEGGTTYFIIVDGWSNTTDVSGSYTLTVAPGCTPSCGEGQCGDDGCGGICPCSDGLVCFEGACCSPMCDGTSCTATDGCGGTCQCNEGDICMEDTGACCAPSCDNISCGGGDGCGNTCGCDTGMVCMEGACTAPSATCQAIQDVACGDVLTNLYSLGAGVTNAFGSYSCQNYASDDYSESFELVYRFIANESANITIDGQDDGTLDLTILKDMGNGCEDAGASCIKQGSSNVEFTAEAGDVFYLVWDSWLNQTDLEFGMAVECCTPSCEGKVCGDDGCGGTCGSCTVESEVCFEGLCCEPACPIDGCGTSDGCGGICGCPKGKICDSGVCGEPQTTCSAVNFITCGQTLTGLSNAAEGSTKAFSKYSCQDWSSDDFSKSLETTIEFLAEDNAVVTVEGENDGTLYVTVLEETDNGCEDLGVNCVTQDSYKAVFDAKAGSNYYFVWDSWKEDTISDFSVTVTCCTPSCDWTTCGGDNGCGGTCGCDESSVCFEGVCCVPSCDNISCGGDDGCGGSCGCSEGAICKDSACIDLPTDCSPALTIDCGGNYPNLSNAMDGVTMAFSYYSCQNSPAATYDYNLSPELVMEYTAQQAGYVTVKGTDDSSLDLFTFKDFCEDTPDTCISEKSSSSKVQVEAGETYYFVWDSWNGSIIDNFSVDVECCTPVCDGTTCGDNGCGEPCTCADESLICFDEACVLPKTGDSCSDPIEITSLPFMDTNDNGQGFSNQYSSGTVCTTGSDFGDDEPDVVYFFIPDASGDYLVTMPNYTQSDGASIVYAAPDCDDVANSCLDSIDFYMVSDPISEGLTVTLEAGVGVYFYVDSYFSTEIGPFTFNLDGPL